MSNTAATLVLLRHGESAGNANGLFTGSLDVPLTPHGITESLRAGELLAARGIRVDAIFTSALRRARTSATLAASVLNVPLEEIQPDWRLSERSYGALTGRPRSEVLHGRGRDLFLTWRRSADAAPPPMSEALHRWLASQDPFDRLPAQALPYTESLRDVVARVEGFYREAARPLLEAGGTVLIVAHGNSLRALCSILDALSDSEISALNIPPAQPLIYEFTKELRPVVRGGRYVNEGAALEAAAEVAAQGGT